MVRIPKNVPGTIQRPLGRDFFRREAGVIDRVVLLLVLLAAWEVLVRATGLGGEFISTPLEVAPATVDLLETEEIRSALAATARAVGAAYVICVFVGVFIGVVLGVSPRAHQVFAPIVRILFATPKMVLVPVFILVFGLGFTGTFTFAVSLGIFPILLGTIDAVREVDSRYLTSARSLGCNRAALTWRVSLPCAFPAIVTALRIGLVQTTLGVLLAELYGATAGVGYYTSLFAQTLQADKVFALFIVVAIASSTAYALLGRLERHVGRWRSVRSD